MKERSIQALAHMSYLRNVWRAFTHMLYETYYKNNSLFFVVLFGVYAIFQIIALLAITILSPLACWVVGYINMKRYQKVFESFDGTYAGKLAHLNKYRESIEYDS
jgi:hypothetical protein